MRQGLIVGIKDVFLGFAFGTTLLFGDNLSAADSPTSVKGTVRVASESTTPESSFASSSRASVTPVSPFRTVGEVDDDESDVAAPELAPTVITDRVAVALKYPLPSSRVPLRFESIFAPDPLEKNAAPNPDEAHAPDAPDAKGADEKGADEKKAAGDQKASRDELTLIGRKIVDARLRAGNGKYMLEDEYGELRIIPQKAIKSVTPADDIAVDELRKEYEKRLADEFGESFKLKTTEHFIIVSDASEGYVDWCARLFENLEEGFRLFARKNHIPLHDSGAPLVVVVFARQAEFMRYAAVETSAPDKLAAYYNMQTNRVALYDLSYTEGSVDDSKRRRKSRIVETREILSRPNAAFNVATIIHEATHQLAFNRGVFLRTGPIALWAAEGMSLVFETPSGLASQGGWNFKGSFPANKRMLALYQSTIGSMADPFRTVVAQDEFYTNLEGSYAASWALFYYLYKKRPVELSKYLQFLADKSPCTVYPAEERLADFEEFFGDDWEKTTTAVTRYIKRL